jgi:hypothetical protein
MRSSLRDRFKLALATAAFLILPQYLDSPPSGTGWAIGVKSANLQQTLESGLRARRPEEFAFLRRVVTMVEQDQLPLNLVRSTFDWARHKRPFQYPYFERALKLRAARLGIVVQ